MTTEPLRSETPRGEGVSEFPARLEEVRRRFAQWRGRRESKGPIPEELWSEAESCAAEYGSYRTARALGLDSGKLKRRIEPKKKGRKKKASTRRPKFVEVTPAQPVPTSECVLEVESRTGTRVRIQLRDTRLAEVAELARSLLREGS